MSSPFRRRRRERRHAAPRAHGAPTPRHAQLHIELLEARLVLSAAPLDGYNQISAAWFGAPASFSEVHDSTATEWLVRLTPEATTTAANVSGARAALGDLGFSYEVVRGLGLPGQLLIQTYAVDENQALSALESHSAIAAAGRNVAIQGAITNANDAEYAQGRLFGLNLTTGAGVGNPALVDADIDAPEAWDVTTGSSSVVVAVLDSGLDYNHPDIANNVWSSGGVHGYDFFSDDADPMDVHGHGTHVAGIIGAEGNNNDGITGVNWDVTLLPVRVLGPTNSGNLADAIAGIAYVTGLKSGFNVVTGQSIAPVNVRVINASWAVAGQFVDAGTKTQLVQAIQAAGAAHILVVVAAGNGDLSNNAIDLNTASYLPATLERDQAVTLDNLIVVAASDPTDRLTYFSNYGAGIVDLAAPGDDILSTLPGGDYGFRDGTSMAAPFVSGVAALVLANPANQGLTAAEVKEAILESVDPLASPDDRAKVTSGGRLNAFEAVTYTAFAPRVAVQSAPNIVLAGAATHAITLRYTGKTAIATGTLGVDDIVVRKGASGAPLTIQSFSHVQVGGDPKVIDVTYIIAGPGDGIWNALDNGAYQIDVVAGSVADTTGVGHDVQTTEAKTFSGAFSVAINTGTFIVQRTDDSIDTNPGNGLPDYGTPGVGFTLRGALQEANLFPGAVVVVRPGTYTLTRAGGGENAGLTGDLDVSGSVTVLGDGTGPVTINGAAIDRVFDVLAGGSLTLDGVTVSAGNSGLENGGGVRNSGTLNVTNSTIKDSVAENGGGIYNAGTLTVTDSIVAGNLAHYDGGGLYNAGQATVSTSTLDQNTAEGYQVQVLEKVGVPFIVNTTKTNYQYSANVAVGQQGDVVVSWVTQYAVFDEQVFAQRLSPTGAFVGSEIFLNDPRSIWRVLPNAAVGPDGKFAISWQQRNPDTATATTHRWDAVMAVFDENGNRLTTINLPTNITGDQIEPDLAVDTNGNYTTGFSDLSGALESGLGVYSRRFASDGTPLTAPVRVPQDAAFHQTLIDVALFENNEAVAIWSHSQDGVNWDIFGRYLTAAGAPTGNQFPINLVTAGNQTDASVAASADGFVVTWSDAGRGIIGRQFNRSGQPITGEIVVATNAEIAFSQAAMLPGGGFAVTWSHPRTPGSGSYDVWVRAYDETGVPIGPAQNLVLPNLAQYQARPSIAVAPNGTMWVVWEGQDPAFDINGIYAQQLSYHSEFNGGSGAGVYNASVLTMTASTISSNDASVDGGGVYNSGTLTATNVTVSSNEVANQGGGIYNATGGTANVNSTTVTNNLSAPNYLPFLDPAFSGDGVDAVNLATGSDNARAMSVQPDGKVVIVGDIYNGVDVDFGVVRYNTDGTLDATFGGDGIVTTNFGPGSSSDHARGVAIQADGKIVVSGHRLVAGNYDFAVARYNSDGTLDSTFDGEGLRTVDFGVSTHDEGKDVAIQSDGKIVVAGYSLSAPGEYEFAVARFNANGSLDASFSGDGKVRTDVGNGDDYAYAVALVAGKIAVAGQTSDGGGIDFAVVRYNDDGSLDTSFSGDGQQITDVGPGNDEAYDIVAQVDGKIVVAGLSHNGSDFDFALVRYNANGTLDASFDSNGRVTTSFGLSNDIAWGVAMQGDKIVVVGEASNGGVGNFAVARYNANGSLDATFDGDGKLTVSLAAGSDGANSVAVIGDNRFYVAGYTNSGPTQDMALLRIGELSTGVGIANDVGGAFSLNNSIVATGPIGDGLSRGPDVVGLFQSSSGNLIGNVGTATGLTHGVNSNIVGSGVSPIDPKLGPLANNGGSTKTHHPQFNSPAIDAGVTAGAPTFDQLGARRKNDLGQPIIDGDHNGTPSVDIGAVESYFASISGKKFHDRNGNGIQNDGEENLQGWTIYLDLDQDGRLDPLEPFDVTDASGAYEFIGLTPGSYTVAEVLQAGWQRTHVGMAYVQELRDDNAGGAFDGLDGARAIASTADDRFVYVAGSEEAKIARFERNATTGQLTYLGTTSSLLTVGGQNVLSSVEQLVVGTTVSGSHLYAMTPLGAIVVFSVNTTTGELTFSQVLREGETHGTSIQQMIGATGMAVSSDGTRVYVSNNGPSAPNGGAIFVFERSGAALLLRRRLANSASVQGAGGRGMAISPDGNYIYVANATLSDSSDTLAMFERQPGATWIRQVNTTAAWVLKNNLNDSAGNFVHGLDGANAIAMSPDGKFLYVTAATDGAVTVLARNAANGSLTFVQTLSDGDIDYLGATVSGLEQASAVAISSDGERVYVAGKVVDDSDPENPISTGAIVTFRRDAATGRLSILEKLVDGVADGNGAPVESIDVVAALLAPDGEYLYAASADYEDAITSLRRDTIGQDDYTLAAGDARTGVDFSNRALPGAIYGLVYDNRNSDGDQDLDERALSGWEVFLDINGNGVWDISLPSLNGAPEPLTESDPTGVYAFENLAADSQYTVRMRPRSGWGVTTPISQFHEVTISPGEIELNKNFGVTLQTILGAGLGTLSGVVFRDMDQDGVQALVGEPGIGGLRVFLDLDDDNFRDAGETFVTTVASGLDIGKYTFGNIPDTPFVVRIDPTSVSASQRILAPLGNSLTERAYDLNPNSNPTQLASADFDLDGDLDLAVLTLDGVVSIFRNNGGSVDQFTQRLALANSFGATSLAVGDFNGDGRPDVALASSTLGKVAVAMNQPVPAGQLAFGAYNNNLTTTLANWDVVASDFNGDGKADLALAQRASVLNNLSNVLVLHSTTTGLTPTFALSQTIQVGRQPRALEVAQVDGVGGLDLLLVNQHDRTLQVVLKSGSTFGSAQTAIPLASLMGSAVDTPFTLTTGHFNGDAKLDILVGNSHTSAVSLLISAPNALYDPDGWDLFNDQSLDARGLPRDLAVEDIDGDGDRDVLAGTVGPSGITLFRNIGTTTAPKFAQGEVKGVGNLQTADLPGVKSLVVGNFQNNGGLLDVAAVSGKIDAGSLLVFANSTINGAHRVAADGNVTGLNFALAPTQDGDYDGDADVDGFDFLKWQRSFGGGSATGADGDGNGVVNGADLTIWKMHFGTPASVAAASASLTVDPSGISDEAAAATNASAPVADAALVGWYPNDRAVAELTNPVVGRPRRELPRVLGDHASVINRRPIATHYDRTDGSSEAKLYQRDSDSVQTSDSADALVADVDGAFAQWGETVASRRSRHRTRAI